MYQMPNSIVCSKPRALHAVTNATMEARSCFYFSAYGGKSKPPAMRVVVDSNVSQRTSIVNRANSTFSPKLSFRPRIKYGINCSRNPDECWKPDLSRRSQAKADQGRHDEVGLFNCRDNSKTIGATVPIPMANVPPKKANRCWKALEEWRVTEKRAWRKPLC